MTVFYVILSLLLSIAIAQQCPFGGFTYIDDPFVTSYPSSRIEFSAPFRVTATGVLTSFTLTTGGYSTTEVFRFGLYVVDSNNPTTYNRIAQSPPIFNTSNLVGFRVDSYDVEPTSRISLSTNIDYYIAWAHQNTNGPLSSLIVFGSASDQTNQSTPVYDLIAMNYEIPLVYSVTVPEFSITPGVGVLLCGSGARGDPVFIGFYGQVYQVHGIPGKIFNIFSTNKMQMNARFDFLATQDAITAGEMTAIRMLSTRSLPETTAFSHDGTYLGQFGIQFKIAQTIQRLFIESGEYSQGIKTVTINNLTINLDQSTFPNILIDTMGVQVILSSRHQIRIITDEVSLTIVNSDHFFNIESTSLSSASKQNPLSMEGLLGQSANPLRYFPKYSSTTHTNTQEKGDWQEHQVMDYLIVDNDIWSNDFNLNRFKL